MPMVPVPVPVRSRSHQQIPTARLHTRRPQLTKAHRHHAYASRRQVPPDHCTRLWHLTIAPPPLHPPQRLPDPSTTYMCQQQQASTVPHRAHPYMTRSALPLYCQLPSRVRHSAVRVRRLPLGGNRGLSLHAQVTSRQVIVKSSQVKSARSRRTLDALWMCAQCPQWS